MKKILSLILTAAMLMSAAVMTTGAADVAIGDGMYAPDMPYAPEATSTQELDENQVDAQGVYYTLDDETNTATVGKNTYADSASADAGLKTDSIVIPSKVIFGGKEYVVTAVGRNAFDGTDIREITVACVSIGEFAFAGCTKLEFAFVNVSEIKGFAFWGCTALTVITCPTAESIGGGAFWNCSNLNSISLNASTIMEKAFEGCNLDYIVLFGDAPAVAAGALGNTPKAYIFSDAAGYDEFPIPTEVLSAPIIDVDDVYGKPGETVEVVITAPAGSYADEFTASLNLAEGLTFDGIISGLDNLCLMTNANYDAGTLSGTIASGIPGILVVLQITLPEDAAGVYEITIDAADCINVAGSITVCDHANTKTVTVKSASCDEAGTANTVCTACGEVISSAEVEAKGHTYKDFVIAPTCTEAGYTRHICECCANAYTDAETEATGHAWNEGEVIVQASTTKDGLVRYTCLTCGTTEDQIVPKFKYGDANSDGSINLSDVAAMLQYIAKWDMSATSFNEVNADANGDSSVNLSDVSKTLQYIAKWDVELGPQK